MYRTLAALIGVGGSANTQGHYRQAQACFREALGMLPRERHAAALAVRSVLGLAWAAAGLGQVERAARLFGAAAARQAGDSCCWCLAHRREIGRNVAAVRAQLDAATWQARWVEGQALSVAQAIVEALDTLGDGMAQAVVASREAQSSRARARCQPSAPLTAREVDVLRRMAQGLRTDDVAAALGLSPLTVTVHLRAIYRKLGVRSRTAATRVALEQQLV